MDQHRLDQRLYQQTPQATFTTTIASGIALLYIIHQVLLYFDYPVLSPQEVAWNALVYLLPKQLLLDSARRQELQANDMLSQTHAAKSEALRRMLGIGGNAVLQKLPAEGILRRASSLGARMQPLKSTTDAPAGLGNWDNSCYQNSVLQGLASLDSLKPYLMQTGGQEVEAKDTTTESLLETVNRLNDASNNGKQLWTPAKLKSMSSWQQQDAQEYFSKIMEELDKEAANSVAVSVSKPGLESIVEETESQHGEADIVGDAADDPSTSNTERHNPLDGLLAQRVMCTRCGHSDGLSMIPFNCLTVPLGSARSYSLDVCLDEYTKVEEIPEVECAKCTLLRAQQQLEKMLPVPPSINCVDTAPPVSSKTLELPPELRAQAFARLSAIQQAIEKDDFADRTLNETCSIPKKSRMSSTKTRQAVIGRPPKSLVVHVNRSVFDELTGAQRKNYASVDFPATLNLNSWIVKTAEGEQASEKSSSLLPEPTPGSSNGENIYRIKAVVTHYGRHENGHYICYRQHPVRPRLDPTNDAENEQLEPDDDDPLCPADGANEERRWWRLSDEDVSAVSEEGVLAQGGVFMLFYEREDTRVLPTATEAPEAAFPERQTAQLSAATEAAGMGLKAAEAAPVGICPDDTDTESTLLIPDIAPFAMRSESHGPDRNIEAEGSSDNGTIPPSADTWTPPAVEGQEKKASNEPEMTKEPPLNIARDSMPLSTSPSKTTPPFMRTARHPSDSHHGPGKDRGFGGSGFRPVAAT
ncbi:ubiquitin-specific protease ubp1 [Saxophila tyrrhenica]|uniref:ubiquitinyl hydrolase 1 n=1 Tax=Saxophila tyrrhenica TaxID=1690608 RepID=A0AAV9NVY4_9PEZI|nr:ubiquitin-specific protease ubp1 [Saxophila tyrrhenica]